MTRSAHIVRPQHYHSLAIVLHWLIALSILFMFVGGLYMVNAEISKAEQYKLFQIHKGAGVLLLLSIILRILVRLFTRQPELPKALTVTDRKLAKIGHIALYIVMLVMPISGWVMVSASPFGLPTIVFDWFQWPHIPGIERNKVVEFSARTVHWSTALIFISLIVLHIGAVVKHQIKENINLMPRMWWRKHNET